MVIVTQDEYIYRDSEIEGYRIICKIGDNLESDKFGLECLIMYEREQCWFELGEYKSFYDARFEYDNIKSAKNRGSKVYLMGE